MSGIIPAISLGSFFFWSSLLQEDGTLERITPAALAPWVGAIVRPGEPLPDLLFFALEEVLAQGSLPRII